MILQEQAHPDRVIGNCIYGVDAPGGFFVQQLTRQLHLIDIVALTQNRLDVGSVQVRIGRSDHDRVPRVDVDLTEHRMQPFVHFGHFRSDEQVSVGQIQMASIALGEGGHRLVFHPLSRVDAGLNRRHAEEIQFATDALARLQAIVEHVTAANRLSDVFSLCWPVLSQSRDLNVVSAVAGPESSTYHASSPSPRPYLVVRPFIWCSDRIWRHRRSTCRSATPASPTPRFLARRATWRSGANLWTYYPSRALAAVWHRRRRAAHLPPVGSNNRCNSIFKTDRSYDVENEASTSTYLFRMGWVDRCSFLYRSRSFQTPCTTRASTGRDRNV